MNVTNRSCPSATRLHGLVLLALLSVGPSSVARGITGTLLGVVRDRVTKQSLPAVNVLVLGLDRGVVTGMDGSYQIGNLRAGLYDVRFSMIGFKTVVITKVAILADLRTSLDVDMDQAAVEVEGVEIVAERPLIQRDLAATAYVIGDQKIDRLPVASFQEVVSMQPGVTREGNVRGGRTTELVYLIDGVPAQDVVSGGLAASLPKNAITGMTVWTGGFDAEYGNALSGVVNVVTKSGSNQHQFGGRVERDRFLPERMSRQTDRATEVELSASGPIELDRMYYFTANTFGVSDTRWWQDMQHFFSSPIRKDLNGFTKLEYVPVSTLRFALQAIYSVQEWRDYEFTWRYNLSGLPSRERRSLRAALQVSHTLSERTYYTATASLFRMHAITGESDDVGQPVPYEYDVYLRYILSGRRYWWAENLQYTYSLRGDLTSQLANGHLLKLGGELMQYDINTDVIKFEPQLTYFGKPVPNAPLLNYSNAYRYLPRSGALFLQDKWELKEEGAILSFGIRWEFLDPRANRPLVEYIPVSANQYEERVTGSARATLKHQFSPRFSFAGPFGPGNFLFINYGQYFQFPLFEYLYSGIDPVQLRLGTRNVLAGNPDLNPERVSAWEIGAKRTLRDDLVLSVTYFQKQYKNQLDSKTLIPFDSKAAGDFGFASYVNNAEASASGFEVLLSRERRDGVFGTFSYSYMSAEGLSEYADQTINRAQWGFEIVARPYPLSWDQRHTLKGDLTTVLPWQIEANIVGLFHSARPYTYYPTRDGYTPVDTSKGFVPNNSRMENVLLLDAKFIRSFALRSDGGVRLTAFADFRNVTNRRNVKWMDSNGRVGGELGDPSAYDMPRRIRLGIRVDF